MTEQESELKTTINAHVAGILKQLAIDLCHYLESILPDLSAGWWSELVIQNLSYQQQRTAEQRRVTTLSGLDLAALIRVLDHNWYAISQVKSPPPESRHFVKEIRSVRDRWAHASVEAFSDDDIYRDLDTIQRFSLVINARESLIEDIRQLKSKVLPRPSANVSMSNPSLPNKSKQPQANGFQVGQIVSPISDLTIRGAVVAVIPGQPENRISVFQDGNIQTYYESQLVTPVQGTGMRLLSVPEFHGQLTALQIRHPALSVLYSLNAGRIDFVPYQFRPVLKFIKAERPRLLIADGVGVGKTIEAGLILRELQARRDIRSVLIICPKPLITERKWEIEMRRFDERFTPLDGDKLRYCIRETDLDGIWPEQYSKVIIPYSQFDEDLLLGSSGTGRHFRKGLRDLNPPPRFDLVIVDEAQHIRNESTFSHQCVRFFCENAEAVLFLTATPLEMGSHDLYVLLNLLRPDLIRDVPTFESMAEPNPYINEAVRLIRRESGTNWREQAQDALAAAARTPWGRLVLSHDPVFQEVLNTLTLSDISPSDRILCIHQLEQLHTFSGMINRTLRRDIGEFTVRKAETVTIDFTTQQSRFHDDLLATQAAILDRLHGTNNVKFMMTMIRRQAASCLFGLAPLLREILTRRLSLTEIDEADFDVPEQDLTIDERIEQQVRGVLAQAEGLDPYDPKLEALKRIITQKQALPNRRVMLFSSFRHTLTYLLGHLEDGGPRVGLVHGDVPDEDRVEIRRRFRLPNDHPEALDVLLFSEVGSEGLDYQFCDCIINYDLPWNPMRIEQRIGRIDRRGQLSEAIRIFNMITPGTVDADIYERCLLRIGIFDRELGASDEILGEITRELRDIAENFALSDRERQEKLHQLADNKIRLIREQLELEQRQAELFAIRMPHNQHDQDLEDASSYWLSPPMLENMVRIYLQTTRGSDQDHIIGERPLKTLRLSQEARTRLLKDFSQLPRQISAVYRDWENWLKGANPLLPITFDTTCASENSDAIMLTPVHPLVRQAARNTSSSDRLACVFETQDSDIAEGDYPFTIYEWRYRGLQHDLVLQPVCGSPQLTARFADLIKSATEARPEHSTLPNPSVLDGLDSEHYKLWTDAKRKHEDRTRQLATFRLGSLETSHRARLALLNEQLGKATDERIRRMRQSQLVSAQNDYDRRRAEIDNAIRETDITAQPIAFGMMRVNRK
jgi:superfamily II DNA or RNA helicase